MSDSETEKIHVIKMSTARSHKIVSCPQKLNQISLFAEMSVVYYKFKAAKDQDFDVYTFDGTGTSVFDLKREIIRAKKLGKGTDFDLAIYNSQSNEGKENRVSNPTHTLQSPLLINKYLPLLLPKNTKMIFLQFRAIPPS